MSYTRLFIGLVVFTVIYIILKYDMLREVDPLPIFSSRGLGEVGYNERGSNAFIAEVRKYDETEAGLTTTEVVDIVELDFRRGEAHDVKVIAPTHNKIDNVLRTSNKEGDRVEEKQDNELVINDQNLLIHKLANDSEYLDDDGEDVNEDNDRQIENEVKKLANYHLALDNLQEMHQARKLFYNRVPKCGSTTIQQHTKQLRPYNNFTVSISHIYHTTAIDKKGFETLLSEISNLPEPWFFTRHIHFVDFKKHNKDMPAYMNLVRNPIDRFQSRYYFKAYAKEVQYKNINDCVELRDRRCTDLSYENETFILVPFFCGQHLYCMTPSQRALNQAKLNIIKYYSVVGVLDEIRGFLQVLEYIFPQFYKHANELYKDEKKNGSSKPATLTVENRQEMQKVLGLEYELFSFIKARFYNLASQINALDTRANITLKHTDEKVI